MQKRTLPLSLLIGAALTIPSLAMAAPADDMTPADMQTATAENTLQNEVESADADAELVSNQSSPFEINETKTISRANINNNPNQVEEEATDMEAMQDPQEEMLQEEMLQEEMLQDPQDATQPLIR